MLSFFLLVLFSSIDLRASELCSQSTYFSNQNGTQEIVFVITDSEITTDDDFPLETAGFVIPEQSTFSLAKEIKEKVPALEPCLKMAARVEIIADSFEMRSASRFELDGKALTIRARRVALAQNSVFADLSTIAPNVIFTHSPVSVPAGMFRVETASDWNGTLSNQAVARQETFYGAAARVARTLYRVDSIEAVESALGIWRAIIGAFAEDADTVKNYLVEKSVLKSLIEVEKDSSRALAYNALVLTSPDRARWLVEAITYRGMVMSGRNYFGYQSGFVTGDTLLEAGALCGVSPQRLKSIQTERLYQRDMALIVLKIPESAGSATLVSCPLAVVQKFGLAEYVPAIGYETALANFSGTADLLHAMVGERDKRVAVLNSRLDTDADLKFLEEKQSFVVANQQTQAEMADKEVDIADKQVKSYLTQLEYRAQILELLKKRNDRLNDIPTNPPDMGPGAFDAMQGMIGGASSAGAMTGGNPYAMVAGALIGLGGFFERRDKANQARAFQTQTMMVDKDLRQQDGVIQLNEVMAGYAEIVSGVEQAQIRKAVAAGQAEIAKRNVEIASMERDHFRERRGNLFRHARPAGPFNVYIRTLSEDLLRQYYLLARTIEYRFKTYFPQNHAKLEHCRLTHGGLPVGWRFQACVQGLKELVTALSTAAGEPEIATTDADSAYDHDYATFEVSETKTPELWSALRATGILTLRPRFSGDVVNASPATDSWAFTFPDSFKMLHIRNAGVWYKDDRSGNTPAETRVSVELGSTQSFRPYQGPPGLDVIHFDRSEFRPVRGVVAREAYSLKPLPSLSADYDAPTFDFALNQLDTPRDGRTLFSGASPVTTWTVRFDDPTVYRHIRSLKIVVLYRYLLKEK